MTVKRKSWKWRRRVQSSDSFLCMLYSFSLKPKNWPFNHTLSVDLLWQFEGEFQQGRGAVSKHQTDTEFTERGLVRASQGVDSAISSPAYWLPPAGFRQLQAERSDCNTTKWSQT